MNRQVGIIALAVVGLIVWLGTAGVADAQCCAAKADAAACAKPAGDAAPAVAAGVATPTGVKACGANCTKPCCAAKPAAVALNLGEALKAIDLARKAIATGDTKAALAALAKAEALVKVPQQAAAKAASPAKAGFVNATCPIMGSKIDPKTVTASLVRTYEGRQVAFCCNGCPAAWDKLTPAQKRAKLAKAGAK